VDQAKAGGGILEKNPVSDTEFPLAPDARKMVSDTNF
jgi:hypothetical protein